MARGEEDGEVDDVRYRRTVEVVNNNRGAVPVAVTGCGAEGNLTVRAPRWILQRTWSTRARG